MDVTTVGSNVYAVTVTGRVLSVLLAALGMMMFPIFTVYVTSLVQKTNQEKQQYYDNSQKKEANVSSQIEEQSSPKSNNTQAN